MKCLSKYLEEDTKEKHNAEVLLELIQKQKNKGRNNKIKKVFVDP